MSNPHDVPGFHHVPRPDGNRHRERTEPFPLDVLPAPVVTMVEAIATSRSISADVPAALSLAACASAIGLSRIAYDDFADWTEPPIIWLVIVIRSGSRKTIVIDDLFAPHKERQQEAAESFDGKLAEYGQEVENWKQRKRRNKSLEAEPKPTEPRPEHIYTSDPTPEALVEILKITERGVLLLVDELAHFFGGFGAYSGKAERDRSFYLALFRGIQFKSDRKGSGSTFVSKAAASIVGGVQPLILAKCFDAESYASGLVSRFLLVDAPPQVKEYRRGPTPSEKARYAEFVNKLFDLKMEPYSRADGEIGYRPQHVPLSEEARELLRGFVPDWSEQSLLESSDVEAAMSKLEGYAIRFALVLRVCREATGTARPEDPISRQDLENGIRLARWFRDRARRIYDDLKADEAATSRSTLLARAEVIRKRFGGGVTVREWQKLNTRRSTEKAKAELDELVAAEMAVWRERPSGPEGGRPTEECRLVDPGPPLDLGEGEVSGCGLRGAADERRDRNGPDDPKKGAVDSQTREGCNPKPPDGLHRAHSMKEGDDSYGGEEPVDECVRPRPGRAVAPTVLRGRGRRNVLRKPPPATRNPQPETHSDGPWRGLSWGSDQGLQPDTPQQGRRAGTRATLRGTRRAQPATWNRHVLVGGRR